MTVSGILGFDNPWWLRGGPSSQSSPGGRRGKTSRPHPCLSPAGGLRKGLRWERGPEQRGRAPTRDAPTGGGWIPAGAGMTVSGILGFDNPRWLRGGPSSQSSPGGRRGKTSRPHPCLSPAGGLRKGLRWERGPEQRGRAPTRDAPTGGGWIPAGAGMTVSGILGFDNPRWLRGGPSSQSSPGGRRGKTSRPHPCLSPAGGLRTQGSRGLRGRWRTHPRRAPPTRLAARALSQSPPEGERFGGALPEEGGQRERASRDSPLREGEKR